MTDATRATYYKNGQVIDKYGEPPSSMEDYLGYPTEQGDDEIKIGAIYESFEQDLDTVEVIDYKLGIVFAIDHYNRYTAMLEGDFLDKYHFMEML